MNCAPFYGSRTSRAMNFRHELQLADADCSWIVLIGWKCGYSEPMSWLKLAFGLIREAAGTQLGQEVIGNIRSSGKDNTSETAPIAIDVQALLAEHSARVDRNLETIVGMVNEQDSRLAATIRRQRVWNVALVAGLVVALILAIGAQR